MFEKLRNANENLSALAFLGMSFAALYVIAGVIHPELLGMGSAEAPADASESVAPAAAPAGTEPAT